MVEASTTASTPCAAAMLNPANTGGIAASRSIDVKCLLPVPRTTRRIQSDIAANDDGGRIIRSSRKPSRISTGLTQEEVAAAVLGWALAFDRGGLWITARWADTRWAHLTPAKATTGFMKRLREGLSRRAGRRVGMVYVAVHEKSEANGLHTHALLRLDGVPDDVQIERLIRHHAGAVYDDAVKAEPFNDRGVLTYMLKGALDREHLLQQLGTLTRGERTILETRSRDQGVVPGNRLSISINLRGPRSDIVQKPAGWALDAA
jgi:hypothetical protein